MAVEYTEVCVWVMVDSDGNAVAVEDGGDLNGRYEEQVQPVADSEGFRLVKVTVKVPLPKVIKLAAEAAEEEDPAAEAA